MNLAEISFISRVPPGSPKEDFTTDTDPTGTEGGPEASDLGNPLTRAVNWSTSVDIPDRITLSTTAPPLRRANRLGLTSKEGRSREYSPSLTSESSLRAYPLRGFPDISPNETLA